MFFLIFFIELSTEKREAEKQLHLHTPWMVGVLFFLSSTFSETKHHCQTLPERLLILLNACQPQLPFCKILCREIFVLI